MRMFQCWFHHNFLMLGRSIQMTRKKLHEKSTLSVGCMFDDDPLTLTCFPAHCEPLHLRECRRRGWGWRGRNSYGHVSQTDKLRWTTQLNYKLTHFLLTYKRQNTFCLSLVIDEGPAAWQLGAAEATLYGSCLHGDLLNNIFSSCQTISSLCSPAWIPWPPP